MISVIGGLVLRTIGTAIRLVLATAQTSKKKTISSGTYGSAIDESVFESNDRP